MDKLDLSYTPVIKNAYLFYIASDGKDVTYWFIGAFLAGVILTTINLWFAPWFVKLLMKAMYRF